LSKACPKEPEVIPFKDIEIDRSEIQQLKKLGAGQFGEVFAGNNLVILFCCSYVSFLLDKVWYSCHESIEYKRKYLLSTRYSPENF